MPNAFALSRQQFAHRFRAFDAGEALIEALEFHGEPLIVDAQAVHDGGVEFVDVDRILDNVVAEVIGFAVDDAALDAAAGHPHTEVSRVVIAAVVFFGELTL